MVCSSSDEDDEEEGRSRLFIACGNGPPFPESCPQAFDQMPVSVSPFGTGDFWIVLPWRDDRARSPAPEILTELVCGITTIADDIDW